MKIHQSWNEGMISANAINIGNVSHSSNNKLSDWYSKYALMKDGQEIKNVVCFSSTQAKVMRTYHNGEEELFVVGSDGGFVYDIIEDFVIVEKKP
jgi:hypothetical protein